MSTSPDHPRRTRGRAEQIKAEFGAKVVVYDWAQAGNMLEGAMTVVNATSMGMEGKPPLRVPLDALAPGTLVTDLVYTLREHVNLVRRILDKRETQA